MYKQRKFWALLMAGAIPCFSMAAEQARLPGGVCVNFSDVTIIQPPDELKKVRVTPSEYVNTLKDCDYRSAITALMVGLAMGKMESCSSFGLAKLRADGCAHGNVSEPEIEKIFYHIYAQAIDDLKICMFKNGGATPIVEAPDLFTRDDMCDELGPERPLEEKQEAIIGAAVGGGLEATK